MLKSIKDLFDKYHKMKIPFVVSAFTKSGRKIIFVVIGCNEDDLDIVEYGTLDRITHLTWHSIEEWGDMSSSSTNQITKEQAHEIYNKYLRAGEKAHDEAGGLKKPEGGANP